MGKNEPWGFCENGVDIRKREREGAKERDIEYDTHLRKRRK
jgi:hypothetical protein